jgi:GT2 family glycosyltransferase
MIGRADVDVDVVILSWNRTPETIEAIESALAQEDVRQRVLILDQGSAPENLARLRRFAARESRVVLREVGRNIGVAAGRNLASDLGDGPYIVALDNDAIFADNLVLRRVIDTFESDSTLGALAFRILNFYTGGDDEMCWDYPEALRPYADRDFEVTRYIGAGHALRRDVFYDAGRYDEELFFAGEERDLGYRILNLGYRIKYVPNLAVRHKVLPGQRVRWDGGRYYYTVRNILYSDYKFGRSPLLLAKAAAALTVKGAYNGVARQALRGAWDAARMAMRFSRSGRDAKLYRLRRDVRDHIRSCERIGRGGVWAGLTRQFQRLPGNT